MSVNVPASDKPHRVLFVGPTSSPWRSIAPDVEKDMARLARPGAELTYRCTGEGPAEIRSDADAAAAAPSVVATIVAAASEAFDAVIVDCTADPGVAEARTLAEIPVVGAGEAMRAAIAEAPRPVCDLSGDDLRAMDDAAIIDRARGAATVAIGGTGFSYIVDVLAAALPGVVVLEPLAVALDACLARLTDHPTLR